MAAVYPRASTAVVIDFDLTDTDGALVSGASDVTLRIQRVADGLWYDWSDSTFKAGASVVDLDQDMPEVDATRAPGLYAATWPGGAAGEYRAMVLRGGVRKGRSDIVVEGLAAPGSAMTLTTGERTTVQALVLSDATPFQGARIDASVSSRSALTAADVWAVGTRTLTGAGSSGLALESSVTALPSAATVADAVWDEALADHATAGSAGAALALVDVAVSSRATDAGVWATAEGSPAVGTYGYGAQLARQMITNRNEVDTTGGGRQRLWDDAGNVRLTWQLRDGVDDPITTPAGSPARRGAAT
ncbi:hypothetical protein [Sorangium sp. So ce1024]|uniref:hypothetical protein n=1 Tax=Sorangium sp. So ce1024 TaxID=3133327 RepID=UPI003EFCAF0B